MTVAVHLDREIVAVKPGIALDLNFGLAVDVGTTTLVMDLVDLDSGKTLDTEAALNSQVRRGADVISRITYVYGDPGKAAELQGPSPRNVERNDRPPARAESCAS